jgi:stearoyl-CoA desaturase (Delta-9 desaturase)
MSKSQITPAATPIKHALDIASDTVCDALQSAQNSAEEAKARAGAMIHRASEHIGDTAVATTARWRRMLAAIVRWFDTAAIQVDLSDPAAERIDWLRVIPFIGLHAMCLGVIWVGFSWFALGVATALYLLRMFAITGFYHRYFSHKAFKTSRVVQFVAGVLGASSVQRGPLWWAAHHRHHHKHSDETTDFHSPTQRGFIWSHMGWFMTRRGFATDWKQIPDLQKFPELKFLDRFDIFVPVALAAALFFLGGYLKTAAPGLHTSGPQLLIWGFFVSTVVLFHATVTINSLSHVWGRKRYVTRDNSRNNWLLAIITLGEGWHNNHHHFPGSARQGFFWWEYDVTYYALKMMSWCGLVWDLKPVPAQFKRVANDKSSGQN